MRAILCASLVEMRTLWMAFFTIRSVFMEMRALFDTHRAMRQLCGVWFDWVVVWAFILERTCVCFPVELLLDSVGFVGKVRTWFDRTSVFDILWIVRTSGLFKRASFACRLLLELVVSYMIRAAFGGASFVFLCVWASCTFIILVVMRGALVNRQRTVF